MARANSRGKWRVENRGDCLSRFSEFEFSQSLGSERCLVSYFILTLVEFHYFQNSLFTRETMIRDFSKIVVVIVVIVVILL